MDVESIVPEPEKSEAGVQDGEAVIRYTFPVIDASKPACVRFQIRPSQIGRRSGSFGVLEKESVKFEQFVFP